MTARHLDMLQRMAELGLQIATAAAENAIRNPPIEGAGPVPRSADPRLMFETLSRQVRRTLALKARIAGRHLPADEAETRAAYRCAAVLDWLQSEIAGAHHLAPNENDAGQFPAHGSNPH